MDKYAGGMGAIGTIAGRACSASGEVTLARGVLRFEIACPHSHFLPLPIVEEVFPWFSFQTTVP